MNIIKLVFYSGVFLLLISDILSVDTKMLVFYAYLSFIYYDCRDNNIRSLVVILAVLEFVFYELDYIFYIAGKYYIGTGAIVGDISLNILILLNMVCLVWAIFFRCEIMDVFSKFFRLKEFIYFPTRADIMQIYVIRFIALIHIGFMLKNAYLVNELNNSVSYSVVQITEALRKDGILYVEVIEKLEFLRHFAIVLVLSPWSKKNFNKLNNSGLTSFHS